MFEAIGKEVTYLKRLTMGPLKLDENLELGEYRELTEQEMQMLNDYM
jgi:16S rRNA uridine-516 pseudouridylate synthase and related pseudouridylate synthases